MRGRLGLACFKMRDSCIGVMVVHGLGNKFTDYRRVSPLWRYPFCFLHLKEGNGIFSFVMI